MNDGPPKEAAPPKSPELVHAEAELARLRDVASRLTWERDTLKRAHEQLSRLGDDHPAGALARAVLAQLQEA
jgi:hypothetical protein